MELGDLEVHMNGYLKVARQVDSVVKKAFYTLHDNNCP